MRADCTNSTGFGVYYSDIVITDDDSASSILHIDITEYVVIVDLCFIVAAHEGLVFIASLDLQMYGNDCDVLVSLPFVLYRKIDDI